MITYGHELYIAKAIEGVLIQQCDFNIELIIADDCSPDNTEAIVSGMIKNDPRSHIICYTRHLENKGMINNFIWTLQQCKGKYIAMCEGDDYWTDPLKLQKQVDFLEENPEYSLCFHNANIIYEDYRKSRRFYNIESRVYTGEEVLREWVIPTASVVFRKDMYEPVHHPDFIFGDIVLYLSMATKGKLFGLNDVMSIYRKHKAGVTKTSKSNLIEYKKSYINHITAIKLAFNGTFADACNEILAERYIDLARYQLFNLNLLFVGSLKKGYLINPEVFFKNFFNIRAFVKSLIIHFGQ